MKELVHYHIPIGEEHNWHNYRYILVPITHGTITRWHCPACQELNWHDSSSNRWWKS